MKVSLEIGVQGLRDELWSGGLDTLEELEDDEVEQILNILEEESECTDDIPSITDLNDFFWHERDTIAKWLGYKNFDEIMKRNRKGESK